jgi:hypothetical protein
VEQKRRTDQEGLAGQQQWLFAKAPYRASNEAAIGKDAVSVVAWADHLCGRHSSVENKQPPQPHHATRGL